MHAVLDGPTQPRFNSFAGTKSALNEALMHLVSSPRGKRPVTKAGARANLKGSTPSRTVTALFADKGLKVASGWRAGRKG